MSRKYCADDPPEKVAKDGHCIKIGGLVWTPKVEAVEVPNPKLHFSRRVQGMLDDKTTFFEGDFKDMENFVPACLSRRMVTTKMASIYDIVGKFAPIIIGLKAGQRETAMEELHHVKTAENPGDIGTRPDNVTLQDVGPDSMRENGTKWMHGNIPGAVHTGTLMPSFSRVSCSARTGCWSVSTTPTLLSCMMMGMMGKKQFQMMNVSRQRVMLTMN